MAHETDVGGMDFASWSPKAREVFQEGLRIPCVKLVDRGEMREDVLEMILTASRLPALLGLDIRAFIATLNVARGSRRRARGALWRRRSERAVMARWSWPLKARLRARLARAAGRRLPRLRLPRARRARERLYKIDLVATKRGDAADARLQRLEPAGAGLHQLHARRPRTAAVTGAVLPTLAYDMPWNEGAMAPVEIVAPDGLLCTAQHPAPVGAATVEAIWVVCNAVTLALNKLLGCVAGTRTARRACSCRRDGDVQHRRASTSTASGSACT